MPQGLQLICRMILVQAKWSSQSNQHGTKGLQLSERCCIAHHLSTFIGKYMLLLMDMMVIAYAIDAILLSWGILTHKPGCWCLCEIQVTPDTRKTKEMASGKLHIPSSKRESRNKLLKLSYQSSMACKCQLVSWTLSCFVAVRMKTIRSEKSTTRAASTGLMVWKQTVQGAGGKQGGQAP